jgi:hypothetical protein
MYFPVHPLGTEGSGGDPFADSLSLNYSRGNNDGRKGRGHGNTESARPKPQPNEFYCRLTLQNANFIFGWTILFNL